MKACFVYIYINLEMSEAVQETEGYPDHGFSACCSTSRSSNTSCLESGLIYKTRPVSPVSGPNGSLGLLTSTNTSYLFEQVVPGIMIAFYVSFICCCGFVLKTMNIEGVAGWTYFEAEPRARSLIVKAICHFYLSLCVKCSYQLVLKGHEWKN